MVILLSQEVGIKILLGHDYTELNFAQMPIFLGLRFFNKIENLLFGTHCLKCLLDVLCLGLLNPKRRKKKKKIAFKWVWIRESRVLRRAQYPKAIKAEKYIV